MGQRRVATPKGDDETKRPSTRKKTGNSVLDATSTRKGEVLRAQRRTSENVAARATQHIIDIPVNKSIYNGLGGRQFSLADQKYKKRDNRPSLKVIPVGGTEIGRNTTVLEYDNEIIVIDMGFEFPGDDYPGINYIVPDITYLEERKNKIKAVLFTHGHLDHIGAFRHLIPKIPAPVYSTKFTIELLKKNMEEATDSYVPEYHEIVPENHEQIQVGDHFSIEFVRVNHSIPDSAAIVVRTPVGVVVASGDWRFLEDPLDDKEFDMTRLTEIASKEGIKLLINESTSCEIPGSNHSTEAEVRMSFGEVMDKFPNSRIIISSFSSQIHRMQSVAAEAAAHGRKMAFAGYSMINNAEAALKTGDLKVPKNTIMKLEDIIKLHDSKVVIMCTGNQGEFNAVLNRMANGTHRYIKIKNSDIIVLSSSRIPGNEGHIAKMEDNLVREGSDVISRNNAGNYGVGSVHLGGHGYHDDFVKYITALNPKFYFPNHGDFSFLVQNAEIAEKKCGVPRDNIFVCDAGDVVELYHDGTAARTGRVHAGGVMYDDAGAIVSEVVLKDRIHMSTEGIFTVVLTVQKGSGRLLSSPDIISRGFIYLRDSEELIGLIRQYLKQKIARAYANRKVDMDNLKKEIRDEVTQILYDQTRRTPIVIPVVNEIGTGGNGNAPVVSPKLAESMNGAKSQQTVRSSQSTNTSRPARPAPALPRPVVKDPTQISFKRRPQGESAGGLWTK